MDLIKVFDEIKRKQGKPSKREKPKMTQNGMAMIKMGILFIIIDQKNHEEFFFFFLPFIFFLKKKKKKKNC